MLGYDSYWIEFNLTLLSYEDMIGGSSYCYDYDFIIKVNNKVNR
jgi:hypothetical protein